MEGTWLILVKCRICKERKMQGKINLNLQGKEIARNGIWKEMEAVRNRICKDWNLQGMEFASKEHEIAAHYD